MTKAKHRSDTLSHFVLLLCLGFFCAGCGGDGGSAVESPTPLLPLHAEPDPIDGGRIVDAAGREVLLRGVNVNAFVEYWSSNQFPITFPLTESDADLMSEIGWNAVRLLLSWSRVEPQPGEYDEQYLNDIEAAVRLLASRGIYSVIDLHQDAWGATLVASPEETCGPGSEPAFGWDGAPGWATLDDGAARCARAGIRETSPAVLASFQAFWDDAEGPGGVGIRTRYTRMLGHIARRFASDEAVAGYDLMNEPNAFSSEQQQSMAEMYSEALDEIRSAEDAAGGFHHLVFFEPSALWSALGAGAPPDFDRDRDVVYAPHIYTGGFNNGPITQEAFQTALDEANGFGGAPVFSGEWGSDPRRASDSQDGYFLTHQALQDESRISATLWTWRESCGDPHKAGDYRAGNIPYVWGEFEVDCRTNAVSGMREALVAQLTRAYPRAAPGRIAELGYDPDTGVFRVSGSDASVGEDLIIFYPASRWGLTVTSAEGLSPPKSHPSPGGNDYVIAQTTTPEWSLEVVPLDMR